MVTIVAEPAGASASGPAAAVVEVDGDATVSSMLAEIEAAAADAKPVQVTLARRLLPLVFRSGAAIDMRETPRIELQLFRSVIRVISPGTPEGMVRMTDADGLPETYFQVGFDDDALSALWPDSTCVIKTSPHTTIQRVVAALDAVRLGGARRIVLASLTDAEANAAGFLPWPTIYMTFASIRAEAEADVSRSFGLKAAVKTALEEQIPLLRSTFELHAERLDGLGLCALDLDVDAAGCVVNARCHRDTRNHTVGDVALATDVGARLVGTTLPLSFRARVCLTYKMEPISLAATNEDEYEP